MKYLQRCATAILAVGLALASIALPAAAKNKPVTIRLPIALGTTITQFMVYTKGVMKHHGKSYILEPIQFYGSAAQLQPFAAKKIDIGWLSWSDFANAIQRAHLDLTVIADMAQDRKPYWSNNFAVLADSPIKTIADLKGKTIGIGSFGTTPDFSVRRMLKRHGLRFQKDVRVVEVRLPNMEPMLRERKIDVANFLNAFWYRAQRKGGIRELFSNQDSFGDAQELMQVGRTAFLKQHPQVVVDFLEDFLRVTRWFWNPKNRKAALAIAVKKTKIPTVAWEPWAFTKSDQYKDMNGQPNIKAIKKLLKWFYEEGYIEQPLDITKYTDFSYLDTALKRLGRL